MPKGVFADFSKGLIMPSDSLQHKSEERRKQKTLLRAQFKTKRAALTLKQREHQDGLIADQLLHSRLWANARRIYSYLSFGNEVDTRRIINAGLEQGKTIALPRMAVTIQRPCGLEWYVIDSLDGLEKISFGLEEPVADPARKVEFFVGAAREESLVIVPSLVLDRQGYRLGYGGGFFDSFLGEFQGVSVGLCRDGFLLDELTCIEPHDIPVDYILSDKGFMLQPTSK